MRFGLLSHSISRSFPTHRSVSLQHRSRARQFYVNSAVLCGRSSSSVHDAATTTGPKGPDVSSAYVHLPFCKRRCFYCDFPVSVVGSRSPEAPASVVHDYVALLEQEVANTPQQNVSPLTTVYFGGGTPSLIPPKQLGLILQLLDTKYGISSEAELSMEADPGTFDAQRLHEYMQLGINRFSVGVQSFQEELLKACGRSHSLPDVHAAIRAVKDAHVPRWSLDLISGLPFLTRDLWLDTLKQAASLEPDHISVYDLQVEDKTPFARWYSPGAAPLPTEEAAAEMFCLTSEVLRAAGYDHYEISSFAQPGQRCRHNMAYWQGAGFYGFGLGASSYLGQTRFARPRTMAAYRAWVESLQHSQQHPAVADRPDEQMLDTVMLSLRTSDGLDLDEVAKRHGYGRSKDILSSLERHIQAGLVNRHNAVCSSYGQHSFGTVNLSDPKGFLLSNDIISDVFAALDNCSHEQAGVGSSCYN